MDQLRQAASKRGVELLIVIRHGEEIHKEILADAREREVDLIVIRRRGKRSYLAKLLLGAMVHKVIDAAACDVLIVPREARIWSRAILLATDGSSHSERATETAVVVAQLANLPVTVISAAGDGDIGVTADANVERALALLQGAGTQATGRTATGKPHEAIQNAAREIGADLIVLGRRGKGGAERVSLGRTAERVVSSAACPVLIVRA